MPHARHVPLMPSQPPEVIEEEVEPALHVHGVSVCEAPPIHAYPAPQAMHVPLVLVQPPDAVEEE